MTNRSTYPTFEQPLSVLSKVLSTKSYEVGEQNNLTILRNL